MRFFHLSDLHIGKQLHHYSLKEDQEHILGEIIEYAGKLHPDAVVIAGDIYDKPVPSAEAVTLFDDFITRLAKIRQQIPVMIISGNHDSADRLRYAAGILKEEKIYLAGSVPQKEEEHIEKVALKDEWGEVNFFLLPFLKPAYVRRLFEENPPETYSDAVNRLIKRENINFKDERNVLISHQFYMGSYLPETCDSETISIGGLDQIDITGVEPFDYVALGHLHGKQKVKDEHIRYCGTPLKYSVSEASHTKALTVVTLGEKGKSVKIEEYPLHPLRDVRKITGKLKEILKEERSPEDYVSITLTDETDPYHPKEQLETVFSKILEVRIDNTRTRTKWMEAEELVLKTPEENFADFFEKMQGRTMDPEEETLILQILEEAREDE